MQGHTKRTCTTLKQAQQAQTHAAMLQTPVNQLITVTSNNPSVQASVRDLVGDNGPLNDDAMDDEVELDPVDQEVDQIDDIGAYNWEACAINEYPLRSTTNYSVLIERTTPPFSGGTPGPNMQYAGMAAANSPLKCFELFFTNTVVATFVEASNAYGRKFINGWKKDLTKSEFKIFIAVILIMGVVKYPNRKTAFDKTYGNDLIRTFMSHDRFTQLLRAWHFEDYTIHTPDELKEYRKKDPFWPVKSFVVLLAGSFRNAYVCGQRIDVDEQSIPFQGRHGCKCYNPLKPEPWHFKVYGLNDACSGYLSNFYLYEGKAENRPANVSATLFPIQKLLNYDQYKDKNHLLATDNWYTSFEAFEYVTNEIGAHYIGTIKVNKRNLPKVGIFPKTGPDKKLRGEMKQMTCKSKSGKDAYFVAWQDAKPVHILTSLKSYVNYCSRNTLSPDGTWGKKIISQPSAVKQYNMTMGGTDRGDQYLSYYRPAVKTDSWLPRVWIHAVNASMVNAFIVHKRLAEKPRTYSLLDFMKQLIDELSHDYVDSRMVPATPEGSHNTKQGWEKVKSRLVGVHLPACDIDDAEKASRKTKRSSCIMCHDYCTHYCSTCTVFLCTKALPGKKNCYTVFHTEKSLQGHSNGKSHSE